VAKETGNHLEAAEQSRALASVSEAVCDIKAAGNVEKTVIVVVLFDVGQLNSTTGPSLW
jgi:hypothetical protein